MLRHLFLFFIGACMSTSFNAYATPLVNPTEKITPEHILLKKITDLKIKDLQKLAGRKFTLKEKIGFGILKYKLKQKLKHTPADKSTKGETALVFGIGSLALLSLSFLIPYALFGAIVAAILAIIAGGAARKKDPSDKKAKTAKLLGWITLGLIAALAIIAVAALSGLSGGW